MTKPRNTTANMSLNTLGVLCMGSDFIALQERQRAREAATSESLPSNIYDRLQWEELGFVFGEPDADDQLFCPATMPPGWSKRATDHSMHTDIVDAAGNKRGSFFYKAAFYDRDAIMYSPLTRYAVKRRYGDDHNDLDFEVVDNATGSVLHSAHRRVRSVRADDGRAWLHEREAKATAAHDEAVRWLDTNYPDHADPGAYWPGQEASEQ